LVVDGDEVSLAGVLVEIETVFFGVGGVGLFGDCMKRLFGFVVDVVGMVTFMGF
jgi:hypothetical protein